MGGFITFPHTLLNRAVTYVKVEIFADEDLSESFSLAEGERPLDLTGMRVEWWCRPAYDHATLIHRFSTDLGVGKTIYIDDPLKGAISVVMRQAIVAATFVPGNWKHFLRVLDDYSENAPAREIFRGDLIVHPGRV
ncbi:hypothetical protein [Tardiphaga sp. 367_B4_N1_1]|uniref:hypothetical protein n=1 Tax=Tardiphaga sp. 367_B4_N1_1 TaxID=3240777 RepID=UPI003F2260C2